MNIMMVILVYSALERKVPIQILKSLLALRLRTLANTDLLYQQAFDTVDPVPLLLGLLRDHPMYPAVRGLQRKNIFWHRPRPTGQTS